MNYLAYLIGSALLIWAIFPLFKQDRLWVSLFMDSEELEDRKRRVYGNIADLEFDFAMGRLSESDFNKIRQSFLQEAGRVLQKLEDQKSSKLMKQIQADAAKVQKKKKTRKPRKRKCAECGTDNMVDAHFCMKCGKALS